MGTIKYIVKNKIMAGENFNLDDDWAVLSIQSPRSSVGGPYKVIYKHLDERFAIVALDWDGKPSLGIRWFWGPKGNPCSTGYPTWFIYPSELVYSLLNGLPLDYSERRQLDRYLSGKIQGIEL